MLLQSFQIAAGTIPGREHIGRSDVLVGRNNQDAFLYTQHDDYIIVVVCDGCGSSPHSEVGAGLGAKLVLSTLSDNLERRMQSGSSPARLPNSFWRRVTEEVTASLRVLARQMAGRDGSFTKAVQDYMLFTVVGAIITSEQAEVFSVGDGVCIVNGEVTRFGPFPGNKPPYLAYNMLDTEFSSQPEQITLLPRVTIPSFELQSLLIGSDGVLDLIGAAAKAAPGSELAVGDISQFWREERYFKNPDALRRKLALLNREVTRVQDGQLVVSRGLLPDDTSLVVVRQA